MKLKNSLVAVCILATVLGAQMAAFAWTYDPTTDGATITDLCKLPVNSDRVPEDCWVKKCKAIYGQDNGAVSDCVVGAYHEAHRHIPPDEGPILAGN